MADMAIIPVIMSGGAGSRLWPLSREAHPKQLLSLVGANTMIQETVARFSDPVFRDPVFICNDKHVAAIRAQLELAGRKAGAIIVEPVGRNTAPCAVAAACHAAEQDENALVLLAPADHHVEFPEKFQQAVKTAIPAAQDGRLVTFGITPDAPETGYGYIEQGEEIMPGVFDVEGFREKPDRETAERYLASGQYAWNAGLFLFSPAAFLKDAKAFVPEIARTASEAYAKATVSDARIDLNPEYFARCPAQSIDYAVMERTSRAVTVPVNMGWSDIGSYASLRDVMGTDESGNAVKGDVICHNVSNSLIQTDGPKVSAIGVDSLAIIVSDGEVLILNLDHAQDVKAVVQALKDSGQTDRL